METIFEKRYCKELKYIGRYETDWLLSYNIQREWALQREKIKYNVEIMTVMNRKSIIITMSAPVLLSKVHELLCKILRYECLFDGRFFKMQKYEIDNLDITAEMRKSMLSYYEGEKAYTKFSQPMNDTIYKRGFCAWERFNKKLLSMNQMFYYIGFGNGMTADLRLALFAEIFEPLSEHLEYFQKVQINCSQQSRQRNARCPKCDFEFKITTQNRPSLRDNFLVDKWLREDRKLNNYVHANGIRFVMDNYVYQNKKEDKHKELIETLQNITDIFLSLLSVIDSIKFHSSDYLDALEMGMKPQEGSQYWVCPIIVEYMNDRFDKKLLQYIQNNEGNGMQFMAEYYN